MSCIRLSSNIVHQYFKKVQPGGKILMKVDTIRLRAVELIISEAGEMSWTETDIAEDVIDQLLANGFEEAGPLEFNLYDSGLAGSSAEQ